MSSGYFSFSRDPKIKRQQQTSMFLGITGWLACLCALAWNYLPNVSQGLVDEVYRQIEREVSHVDQELATCDSGREDLRRQVSTGKVSKDKSEENRGVYKGILDRELSRAVKALDQIRQSIAETGFPTAEKQRAGTALAQAKFSIELAVRQRLAEYETDWPVHGGKP